MHSENFRITFFVELNRLLCNRMRLFSERRFHVLIERWSNIMRWGIRNKVADLSVTLNTGSVQEVYDVFNVVLRVLTDHLVKKCNVICERHIFQGRERGSTGKIGLFVLKLHLIECNLRIKM